MRSGSPVRAAVGEHLRFGLCEFRHVELSEDFIAKKYIILNKNHDHRFKQVERWVGVFVVPKVGGGVYPGCMPSGGSRRVDIRVHEQIDQLSRRSWSKKLVQEVGPRSRRRGSVQARLCSKMKKLSTGCRQRSVAA